MKTLKKVGTWLLAIATIIIALFTLIGSDYFLTKIFAWILFLVGLYIIPAINYIIGIKVKTIIILVIYIIGLLGIPISVVFDDQEKEDTKTCYVTANNLNVREGQGINYKVVSKLIKNDKVNIVSEDENGWTKISLTNGQEGYVSSKYISDEKEDDNSTIIWIIVLFVGGFFIYSFFFGSGGSEGSLKTIKQQTLNWYYCSGCRTVVKQKNKPRGSNNCVNRKFHDWYDMGKVGDKNYMCSNCSITIQTKDTPRNYNNCINRQFHEWKRL